MCASLGLAQSVKAEGTLTVAGIQSALQGGPQALNSQQAVQPASDEALSALSSFVQQIGTPAARTERKIDDQAFAALQDFAQRLGTAQPQSIKDLPQVAQAGSLLEFLQQGGSSSPAEKPKAPQAATPRRASAPVDATFVGAKTCLTCHANQTATFEKTLMGRIGKTQKGKFDCENCHGPGSAHVKAGGGRGVGGIISFRPEDQSRTAEENNEICLACHKRGARTNWPGSTHENRGLQCSNCHTVMKQVSRKAQLKTAFQPDTCFQCHKDRRVAVYRSGHMPLREGKVACSDCHNPHGSVTEALLKKDSVNEVCYTCHAERRGPFLFEHAPVRENCLNCHDPHGTVNEYSLKVSRPRLCQECHAIGHGTTSGPGGVTGIGIAFGLGCQNCHTNIHGSNSPAGALFHR